MSENTTRLFRLDTGFDPYQNNSGGSILLPEYKDPSFTEEDFMVSPLAEPLSMRPSIDARLREVLKPVIHDINVLKPENFYALSKSTCEAIAREARNEKSSEAMEALAALNRLLKGNLELLSFLNQSLNRVHKA